MAVALGARVKGTETGGRARSHGSAGLCVVLLTSRGCRRPCGLSLGCGFPVAIPVLKVMMSAYLRQ